MSPNRDLDAYSDAVLVAILRFLVARGSERTEPLGDREPIDGVLTVLGVETVDDLVRGSLSVGLFYDAEGSSAGKSYDQHRLAIDPLWSYVRRYGLDALVEEVSFRVGAEEPPSREAAL